MVAAANQRRSPRADGTGPAPRRPLLGTSLCFGLELVPRRRWPLGWLRPGQSSWAQRYIAQREYIKRPRAASLELEGQPGAYLLACLLVSCLIRPSAGATCPVSNGRRSSDYWLASAAARSWPRPLICLVVPFAAALVRCLGSLLARVARRLAPQQAGQVRSDIHIAL